METELKRVTKTVGINKKLHMLLLNEITIILVYCSDWMKQFRYTHVWDRERTKKLVTGPVAMDISGFFFYEVDPSR